MSIVACDCISPAPVFVADISQKPERWHVDDADGVWCCIQNAANDEYIKVSLISESAQFTADREALQDVVEAEEASLVKLHQWQSSREYPLICTEESTASTSYARKGGVLSFDPSKVPDGFTIKFFAILEVDSGSAYALLYNLTDSTEVTQSELSSTSTTPEKVSAALTEDTDFPSTEKLYEVRIKASTGTVTIKRASIEVTSS